MAEHLNVFLSSTSKDLQAHRQMAKQAISDLDAFPVAMEEFTADKANALKKCYDAVQKAEVFIGIYAHRYGFAPLDTMRYETVQGNILTGDGVTSITEWEYRWAVERDIPMLLYILAENEEWQPKWIDGEPEKSRLAIFKANIRNEHIVPEFTTPENLAYQIATDLSRILTSLKVVTPIFQRADFYQHIPFPLNYVRRLQLLQDIKNSVLQENSVSKRNVIALHGMGGVGKSVMARALCEDETVRATFKDGILWARLGQQPDLIARLREWITILGGTVSETAPSLDSLRSQLAQWLENKTCLLIVDDVWERKHAEAFLTTHSTCRFLITTRDSEIARALRAQVHSIRTMQTPEAILLLEDWSDGALADTPHALKETIVEKLGHLPLAIRLAGAQLQRKDPQKWLETYDSSKLQLRRVEDVHDSLELTFGLSLSALNEPTRQQYIALAIFKEDEPIIRSAITHLWHELEDWDDDEIHETIEDLASRALLELTTDGEESVILHDLLRDFIGKQSADIQATHHSLLRAYNPQQKAWHTIADDGYLYDHLAYHLQQVGDIEALRTLFADTAWLEVRVAQRDYDYDGYISDLMTLWYDFIQPQALAQIEIGEEPYSMSEIVRYALIRTSINSLASNYAPELIGRAFELGLRSEKWAMGMAQRKTQSLDRADAFLCLLKTGRLNATHTEKAHEEVYKLAGKTTRLLTELHRLGNTSVIRDVQEGSFSLPIEKNDWEKLVEKNGLEDATEKALNALEKHNIRGIVAVLPHLNPDKRAELLNDILDIYRQDNQSAFWLRLDEIADLLTSEEVIAFASHPAFEGHSWTSITNYTGYKIIKHLPKAPIQQMLLDNNTPIQEWRMISQSIVANASTQGLLVENEEFGEWFKDIELNNLAQKLPTNKMAEWFVRFGKDIQATDLDQAFAIAIAIDNKQDLAVALSALAPRLNHAQLAQAIVAIREIKQYTWSRAIGLAGIAPYLPSKEREEVIADGLETARSLEANAPRAKALRLFLEVVPQRDQLLYEIRRAIIFFWLANTTSTSETLLLFLATPELFSHAGVFSQAMRERLAKEIEAIQAWKWV